MNDHQNNVQEQQVEITFAALVLAFSSAALSYMGYKTFGTDAQNDNAVTINLPLAKQNIDIIELLHQKTKGNLNEDEENLIKDILIDLKMKFVEISKKQ